MLHSTNPAIPDQDLNYVYDALGNRIRTIENGVTVEYTTNNMNQYTRVGDTTYVFDADGNLIRETSPQGTATYTYNDENRLVSVTSPAGTWQYTYDALGNRVATTEDGVTTRYVIDPIGLGNVVGEYTATGQLIAHYDHGFGLISRTDSLANAAYYTFDAIGSTSALTSATGVVANRYVYGPFGTRLRANEAIPNPFEYVGELGVMSEGNGLDYMRARFFDASLGRFSSDDPLGLAGGDANTRRYVANNPVSRNDPTGLCKPTWYDYLIRYGNWGGPHWSGGQWVDEGGLGPRDVEPVDWVDAW